MIKINNDNNNTNKMIPIMNGTLGTVYKSS